MVESLDKPKASYTLKAPIWKKNRVCLSGEEAVKAHDLESFNPYSGGLETTLLLPFDSSMTTTQFRMLVAEASWPGITSQFSALIVGGLLSEGVSLTLPVGGEEAFEWIRNRFCVDSRDLLEFTKSLIEEHILTGQTFVRLDFPKVSQEELDNLTAEERSLLRPYPVIVKAEQAINWKYGEDGLQFFIIYEVVEDYSQNPYHPEHIEKIYVHELNSQGQYQVITYYRGSKTVDDWKVEDAVLFLVNDRPLTYIPIYSISDDPDSSTILPPLNTLVNKEVSLYNKVARRDHLLYSAATFTPIFASDSSTDDTFYDIVNSGLGSWIRTGKDDRIYALQTPTDAVSDLESTIQSSLDEMAKLGVRMLSTEKVQSGVALQIRNAAQNAKISQMSVSISSTMKQVIANMLEWHYNVEVSPSEVSFTIQDDFTPIGGDSQTLTLIGNWYESGLIPRSVFLHNLQSSKLLPSDYSDDKGQEEIMEDDLVKAMPEVANKELDITSLLN